MWRTLSGLQEFPTSCHLHSHPPGQGLAPGRLGTILPDGNSCEPSSTLGMLTEGGLGDSKHRPLVVSAPTVLTFFLFPASARAHVVLLCLLTEMACLVWVIGCGITVYFHMPFHREIIRGRKKQWRRIIHILKGPHTQLPPLSSFSSISLDSFLCPWRPLLASEETIFI